MSVSTVGKHTGTIIATGLQKASTGNIQVLIQFEDEKGDTITAYLSTTDGAMPWTEKKLAACGYVLAENDYDFARLNDPDCPIIGMKNIPFTVEEKKGLDGEFHNRVGWIGEGGGGGITERMDPNETKAFAAQLRAKLIGKRGPAPKKEKAPWTK
jgi:hypothetical protein